MSLWISESLGLSPDATNNLGPWSCHAAWGRTVTANNATIPAMLTVHKMSAMICIHCAHHLPVPVWSPWLTYMLRFPHALCLTYTHNHPPLLRSSLYPESPMPILSKIPAMSFLLTIPTLNIPVMRSPACSVTQKLLCSLHLSCMLCGAPAQEASLLAPQTEGMCLPGDSTGEIRGLTAERGSAKTEGEERNRETERWHERE